jgi:hypothetical protein
MRVSIFKTCKKSFINELFSWHLHVYVKNDFYAASFKELG